MPGDLIGNEVEDAVRARLLRGFTHRNAGRLTRLEEDSLDVGAQVEETARPLRGVSYDPHGRSVTIMLGDLGTADGHLTRSIADVVSVDLKLDPLRRDSVLRIAHGNGQTLLRLIYG
ncbi:MAG TPA: DUF5335 family protein [Longimicrobium sp.]|nr:DUF5335 family protein [Longimicrobium sp.]